MHRRTARRQEAGARAGRARKAEPTAGSSTSALTASNPRERRAPRASRRTVRTTRQVVLRALVRCNLIAATTARLPIVTFARRHSTAFECRTASPAARPPVTAERRPWRLVHLEAATALAR